MKRRSPTTDEANNGHEQAPDGEPQPPIGMPDPVPDRLGYVHETLRDLITRWLDSTHHASLQTGVDRTTDRGGNPDRSRH